MSTLREDADVIIQKSIEAVLPDAAVKRALIGKSFGEGRLVLVAAGKAAWTMAEAAAEVLGDAIDTGIIITKYGHSKGPVAGFEIYEAGHPVPDVNSFLGTAAAMDLVEGLSEQDTVLFLLSGGGSALFEIPLISPEELQDLTNQLLACGADIKEMNTIRKRVSAVKGGKFALACRPASVYSIVLSDVLGDPLDMIASGPAWSDSSTCEKALSIVQKYGLKLSDTAMSCLQQETPKELDNVTAVIAGNVHELVRAAAATSAELGYEPRVLTEELCSEAREAGEYLASIARTQQDVDHPLAYIAGGETVVHLKGTGKGGRNQEIALSAALGIEGLEDVCIFSVGSDGTDGPTDAAGGYADGHTVGADFTREEAQAELDNNNAYYALQKTGGLIMTGPTGTNVNDLSVLLIR